MHEILYRLGIQLLKAQLALRELEQSALEKQVESEHASPIAKTSTYRRLENLRDEIRVLQNDLEKLALELTP